MARMLLFVALTLAAGAPVSVAHARSLRDAIVHVESRGNPNATGRHGEIGLMQIKCRTARGIGFRGKCRDLYKPAVNLRWGGKYLALALRRAHGNLCHAATLYNAGIHARPHCSAYGRTVVAAMGRR